MLRQQNNSRQFDPSRRGKKMKERIVVGEGREEPAYEYWPWVWVTHREKERNREDAKKIDYGKSKKKTKKNPVLSKVHGRARS